MLYKWWSHCFSVVCGPISMKGSWNNPWNEGLSCTSYGRYVDRTLGNFSPICGRGLYMYKNATYGPSYVHHCSRFREYHKYWCDPPSVIFRCWKFMKEFMALSGLWKFLRSLESTAWEHIGWMHRLCGIKNRDDKASLSCTLWVQEWRNTIAYITTLSKNCWVNMQFYQSTCLYWFEMIK